MNGESVGNRKRKPLIDQKGQMMMESLLLMLLSIGLLAAALNSFREARTLDRVVNTAWTGVATMGEMGNWPNGGATIHPNSSRRTRTLDPLQ